MNTELAQYELTLRDYFAAHAMVAIMSTKPESEDGKSAWTFNSGAIEFNHSDGAKKIARLSYELADAMLREREKGGLDAE